MIDIKHILVPTDFSKFSRAALNYAMAFAEKFDAELHLLHVVQNLALMIPDTVNVVPPVGPSMEQFIIAVQNALDRLIQENQLDRFPVHKEVREGTPFYEIIQYAKQQEMDLIVMGTHGHSGLAHVLLGSVAEKVVRKAPCPVLTIRHPEHEFIHP